MLNMDARCRAVTLAVSLRLLTRSPPTGGAGKTPRHENRPNAVGSSICGRFPNFDKSRSEEADDVISGVAVYYVGMDVRATFG